MEGPELKIEYLPVEDLTPYEGNARKHGERDVAAVAASIGEFDFCDPIGIWGKKNLIVEGHGRLRAAKQRGLERVPCIRLDHLTDAQRRAYALAHNRTAELSEWDELLKSAELADLEALGAVDLEALGFDLPDAEPEEIIEDEPPEPPEEPKTRRGDIFQLGRHRLMCGDSTDADSIKSLMGGGIGRYSYYKSTIWRSA